MADKKKTGTEDLKETEKQEKLKTLNDKMLSLQQGRYFFEQECVTNYLSTFSKDKYMVNGDGSISKVMYTSSDTDKVYTKPNQLFKVWRNTYSKIYGANPLVQAEPEDLSSEGEFAAELAESLIYSKIPEWKQNGLYSKNILWFHITGNAITETIPNKTDSFLGYDEKGTKVTDVDVDSKSVPVFLIYWDPIAHSLKYSNYAFKLIIMHKKIVEKIYSKSPDELGLINVTDNLKYKILLTGDYGNINKQIDLENYYILCKYYEKPNILNTKGEITLFSSNQILETKEWPWDKDYWPFSHAKRSETGFSIGETPLTYSTALDLEYTLFRGQLMDHSENFASPVLKYPIGADFNVKKIGSRRVKAISYNSKYGDVGFIQPTEFSQYFFSNMSKLEEDIGDLNAIHGSSMGKRESGVRSGLQQAQMIDADDSQLMPDVANLFEMYSDVAENVIKLMPDVLKGGSEKTKVMFGIDNVAYLKYTADSLKKKVKIRISVIAGLPLGRKEKQQELMQLMAAGYLTKAQGINMLELGNVNQVYRIDMKDKLRQLIELEDLRDGKDVPTNEEDNDLVHMKEMVKYFKTSSFLNEKEKAKTACKKHYKAHNDAVIIKFKENPIMASQILNISYMDQQDLDAIQMEIQKQTAQAGGQAQPGGNTGGSSVGSGLEIDGQAQATTSALPPQITGVKPAQ